MFLSMFWGTSACQAEPADPSARVAASSADALVSAFTTCDAPGVSVAVYRKGSIVYEKAVGMADLEHHTPMDVRSVFDIASMSKQFTAFAVVLLEEDGKLSLDDDIRTYISELRLPAKVTIRQLLQHTSGIRDYIDMMSLAGDDPELHVVTQDEILRWAIRQRSLNFPPGTEFRYENTSYALMATLVQRVSGKSLRDFARERIFEPLGMTSTRFEDDHAELIEGRAMGYVRASQGWKSAMPLYDEVGDGGVWTTVEDLAKWDQNFYEPKIGGARAITTVLSQAKLADGETMSYALGLFVQQHNGLSMVSHGGVDPGYRVQMLRFPTRGLTVAVLGNNSDFDIEGLASRIADIYLGRSSGQSSGPPRPPQRVAQRDVLIGRYLDPTSGRIREIIPDGPGVALKSGSKIYPLAQAADHTFGNGDLDAHILFDRTTQPTTMVIRWNGQSQTKMRKLPGSPAVQDRVTLVGNYESAELGVTWTIIAPDSKLMLEGPNLRSSLTEIDKDAYESDFGLVVFKRDNAGRVNGLTLSNIRDSNIGFARLP
jgi:CubicO group peptidase (beta-lactamase class C family)